jgi:anthranilate phosphoribosyltransferase
MLNYALEETIMDKILDSDVSPDETAGIMAAIEKTCAEIARAVEQMRKDQMEIDQLKAETRAMLEKLRAA